MKKLLLSHSTVFYIYDFITQNKPLPVHLFKDLLFIIIYTLLGQEIAFSRKGESVYLPSSYNKNVYLETELLEKALYLVDATTSLDETGHVKFVVSGIYKEQIQTILIGLLKNRNFRLKPIYDNLSFYMNSYVSICANLKLEEDLLFTSFMQNLRKKSKSITLKVFSVTNSKDILEVQLYSKYNHFDKEYCNNYRFSISKSLSANYPVGSHVFGVIHHDSKKVTIYKDPECLHPFA